ncbi:hypothetical protein [Corynebacterium terpenotabidum]|uniref:Prolipoprotein LppL n=1 Tax=Corynebacterium terpenotabidum Y-11 TaxID=1200352 RepID=S4XDZ1_9CORY|nr:hypothetical protein [Corynebacterium terpenotabidum]AGP30771.1 hypothetical protein A606_05620 [Corynebacterium terpenotabidum Y-11]
MKRLTPTTVCTSVVALATVLTLTGCSGSDDDGDGGSVVGVAATPAASPDTGTSDATGDVTDGTAVTALVRAGEDNVAALGEGTLTIGSLAEIADGSAAVTSVDSSCDSATGALDGVVLSCGETVKILDTTGRETRSIDVGSTVTAAAVVPDGTVAVTTEGSDMVRWYDAEGLEEKEESATSSAVGMVLVGNDRNATDDGTPQWRVAVLDAEQSSIIDIDMDTPQYNAGLRVGQGLGTASAGREADGVVVVSDPRSDQALVYTVTDVIRHTQAVNTGVSPWAVLWDSARQLLWVSTTGDNRLTSYSLSTGTPVEVGHVDTVADVRYIQDNADGDILLIAADGARELIPAADLPTGR